MWSNEDATVARGHQHAEWTSVSLAITSSGKRKIGQDGGDSPKRKVFTVTDDVYVDQERARAQANRLVSEGSQAAAAGEPKKALAKFDQASFFDPENATCHEMKAQILNNLGRTWDGVQAALNATQLKPDWSEAWVTLAQCQGNLGEPELALASLAKAREAAGDAKLMEQEVKEWEKLASARKQGMPSEQARVNVVDPDRPD
eukprot:jgi/Ulvmu1/12341/UM089_0025.1